MKITFLMDPFELINPLMEGGYNILCFAFQPANF